MVFRLGHYFTLTQFHYHVQCEWEGYVDIQALMTVLEQGRSPFGAWPKTFQESWYSVVMRARCMTCEQHYVDLPRSASKYLSSPLES